MTEQRAKEDVADLPHLSNRAPKRAPRARDPWATVDDMPDDLEARELHLRADAGDVYDYLRALLERPAWWRSAACRGTGPDMFFPERGDDLGPALEVCQRCLVVDRCADAGAGEKVGVWGGESAKRRRDRRRSSAA